MDHTAKNLLIVIGICTSLFFRGYTQTDSMNFSKESLEREVKSLIDSVRVSRRLPALFNDSVLYQAADHHVKYMKSKKILTHEEQGDKKKNSPFNRVIYYSTADTYSKVGENVAYTSYNTSARIKTEKIQMDNTKDIARYLVYLWVNSRGHFQNILDRSYQETGVAVAIDTEQQRIYICQVFARKAASD